MTKLRTWSTMLLTATLTAALLIVVAVVAIGGDDGSSRPARAGTETTPVPAGHDPGTALDGSADLGPENVPLLEGRALGPARSPAPGQSRGGIPCGSTEQLSYHVHARLSLFVDGKPRSVPLGVGIGPPLTVDKTPRGKFASGGSCFSFLHTHAADGIIHIEAPRRITFRLGQFFDVWAQRLDRRHLGDHAGPVVAYVNGKRYRGDPRAIPLRKHAQIQLEIGQPIVAPVAITFPSGL